MDAKNNGAPAAVPVVGGACRWRQQEEGYELFSTACGREYEVNDATNGNVNLPFCPFCARRVQGSAWNSADEGVRTWADEAGSFDQESWDKIDLHTQRPRKPAPAAVQVDDAKPNLLTWQLRNQLQHLVRAGRYLEDRVIETRGAKCMDDFDHELSKAEKLLSTHPQPAAAGGDA